MFDCYPRRRRGWSPEAAQGRSSTLGRAHALSRGYGCGQPAPFGRMRSAWRRLSPGRASAGVITQPALS